MGKGVVKHVRGVGVRFRRWEEVLLRLLLLALGSEREKRCC